MENFTTTTMDTLGRPARRLTAERMDHYPANDLQVYVHPYLLLYDASQGEPWQVVSERGEVPAGGKELMLLGNVDIWRNKPDGSLEIRDRLLNNHRDTICACCRIPTTPRRTRRRSSPRGAIAPPAWDCARS